MQIPRPPTKAPSQEWQRWAEEMTKALQQVADRISPRNNTSYTITNGTIDRTYDANATSTAELADVIYTLQEDLKAAKILK